MGSKYQQVYCKWLRCIAKWTQTTSWDTTHSFLNIHGHDTSFIYWWNQCKSLPNKLKLSFGIWGWSIHLVHLVLSKFLKNIQHVEENMKGTTFSDFLAAAYFLTSRKCHRILFDRRWLSMLFIQCWKCASGLVGLLSKGTFIPSVGRYRQDVWSIPNLWKTSGHLLHSKIQKVSESQKSDVKCAYQHISVNRLHLVLSSSSVSANWSSFDKTGWGLCWATRVKVGAQSMRQLPYILTFWAVYFFCNIVK